MLFKDILFLALAADLFSRVEVSAILVEDIMRNIFMNSLNLDQ